MKQKFSFFLFLVFLFSARSWGQETVNLTPTMTAVFSCGGGLTISSTNPNGEAMCDSNNCSRPWFSYRPTTAECNYLSGISIGQNITHIGSYAFNGICVQGVALSNSVTSIGDFAFYGNTMLELVNLPNSLTSIGDCAFGVNGALSSITIPNSVTTIGDGAFYACGLTSITLPNSLTTIGNAVFEENYRLTSVIIPNSVISIGDYAFGGCAALSSLTIPNSVTSIGYSAFGEDFFGYPGASFKDVIVEWATPLPVSADIFNGSIIEAATLHVPAGTKALYQATPVWKDFGTIVEKDSLSVSPASLSFAYSGEQKTFAVTSNTEWAVSSNASWLTVSPASGNDNDTIKVTATANTALTKRTATITISGTGVTTQTISVTQDAAAPTLSVSPTSLSFTYSGEQKTFAVTSNTEWAVSSDASWLTVSPVSGSNNGSVTVTASANAATTQRTATLTISGTGVTAQTISITQDANPVIPVTSVVLNYSASELTAGETLQLTATVFPSNATNPKVGYVSNNPSVATVSASGLITAKAAGTATVTATTEDGNKTATCIVTVKDISVEVPDETQPVGSDGKGSFSLNLTIPSDATLTGSFEIQLPAGMTPDFSLTVLAPELAGNFNLSFTSKGNNTWLITISANSLKSSTAVEYRKILDIAYTVSDTVPKGTYNASIKNLDFLLNNGTPIKEDLITVPINVGRSGTAIENINNTSFNAYFINNMLRIESSQAETITIYSAKGVRLYSKKKDAGIIEIPFSSISGSVYVIKGSKSGTIKTVR